MEWNVYPVSLFTTIFFVFWFFCVVAAFQISRWVVWKIPDVSRNSAVHLVLLYTLKWTFHSFKSVPSGTEYYKIRSEKELDLGFDRCSVSSFINKGLIDYLIDLPLLSNALDNKLLNSQRLLTTIILQ